MKLNTYFSLFNPSSISYTGIITNSASNNHRLCNVETSKSATNPGSQTPDPTTSPRVAVIMGSQSDWSTMSETIEMLNLLQVPSETKIVSAHRTPDRLYSFAKNAKSEGIKVIIAGAGGAAHLPGMVAAMTTLPVLAVPVKSSSLSGLDSLLSIVQMPGGVPVGTLAIGPAGAKNAALLACQILALDDEDLANRVSEWRQQQTENVADLPVKLATE